MKKRSITLKQRIVIMFLSSMCAVFVAIFFISNYAMDSLIENKINASYESNTKQVYIMLDNIISNINHLSQQLASNSIVLDLEEYIFSDNTYKKIQYGDRIKENMNSVVFTNPNIGLTLYKVNDGDILFTNGPIRSLELENAPVLAEYNSISYLGPYKSKGTANDNLVIAAVREFELANNTTVTLYIESAFRTIENILSTYKSEGDFPILFLNNERVITYTQSEEYKLNSKFIEPDKSGQHNSFYWYKETSNQGWSIVLLVPKNIYNEERNDWITQMVFLWILIALFCFAASITLWKKVYRPLQRFDKEINNILIQDTNKQIAPTNIVEYDYLLQRFADMKQQIQDMIAQVSKEEKMRADLEVEKLRYQINPHFLMNTLNTVHWMAVMEGQNKIDKVVQALNRLLLYNLNKESYEATVAQEINAVKEYLLLQQIRYEFDFDSKVYGNDTNLEYICPKFILQPLVENALYRGYKENMNVQINVYVHENDICIDIIDDGIGMTQEQCEKLLKTGNMKNNSSTMGIGVNYVVQALKHYYNGEASFSVDSALGEGTTIHLKLPKKMEG